MLFPFQWKYPCPERYLPSRFEREILGYLLPFQLLNVNQFPLMKNNKILNILLSPFCLTLVCFLHLGCGSASREAPRIQTKLIEPVSIDGLSLEIDALLAASADVRKKLNYLQARSRKPVSIPAAEKPPSAPSPPDTSYDREPLGTPAIDTSTFSLEKPKAPAKPPTTPPITPVPRISLSYGEIPFGKTMSELSSLGLVVGNIESAWDKITLENSLNIGYVQPKRLLSHFDINYNSAYGRGTYNSRISNIEISNMFSDANGKTFKRVQFVFFGKSQSKTLGLVIKEIALPFESRDTTAPLIGMINAISRKVGSEPLSKQLDPISGTYADITFNCQYVIWETTREKIAILNNLGPAADVYNEMPVYIIHASPSELRKYNLLENEINESRVSEGNKAVESSF
uniref:Uncharacterized protein n=1 Tax=uncultured marine microorganism HF4000_APKG3D20 TaxID=455549 RepID=B3T7B4_9ZZZZ|nr:hypothetical protein ALOHA_HF4000APKG3D20ctg1g21 [uncultured marine microorganism HF4000_APKG3D20]